MAPDPTEKLRYKRSSFSTRLPQRYLYSPSHYWLEPRDGNVLRVGLTKFSTRMLGDMVDLGFDAAQDAPIKPGEVIGWIEGFKAIADIYCVAEGAFIGANPALEQDIELVSRSPYLEGWLFEVRGASDTRCVDVHGYAKLLDEAIDRILEQQQNEDS